MIIIRFDGIEIKRTPVATERRKRILLLFAALHKATPPSILEPNEEKSIPRE